MSHGITRFDQVLTVGTPAWHGLGITVQGAPSLPEARKLAGLEWEPILEPAFYSPRVGSFGVARYPGAMVLRSDNGLALGPVSDQYRVFGNGELFKLALAIQERTGATVETAGSVGAGRRVFLTLRAPTADMEIAARGAADGSPSDRSLAYVVLVTGHDGSTALRAHGSSVRVVCANTIRASAADIGASLAGLAGTEGLQAIDHDDPQFERKVEMLSAAIAGQVGEVERLHAILTRAADVPLTSEQRASLFYSVWQELQDGPFDAHEAAGWIRAVDAHDDTMQFGLQGTLYAAVQSLTGFHDHRQDGGLRSAGSRVVNESALKSATMRRVAAMVPA